MHLSISDSMVSEFISGLFVVFALIGVGAAIMLLLIGLAKKFPFCRISLVLALTPFSLIRFLERDANSTLFLFAMIVVLLGITIDGINYVLTPRSVPKAPADTADESKEEAVKDKSDSGMIVWEKAE
ncbi:hypothetical protein P4C99_14955 [Pontiellaceae bacterium B1224]|nr:hypothetical protein [Pontiellaceae bacterium B1224]